MFHLDGSETSWLVYADWLEDQNIDAKHIREPVEMLIWHFDSGDTCDDVGSSTASVLTKSVGGYSHIMFDNGNKVGVHSTTFFDIGVGGKRN